MAMPYLTRNAVGDSSKYYVVYKGRECGVFTDWGIVEKLVSGFAGNSYKRYKTVSEAERAYQLHLDQMNDDNTIPKQLAMVDFDKNTNINLKVSNTNAPEGIYVPQDTSQASLQCISEEKNVRPGFGREKIGADYGKVEVLQEQNKDVPMESSLKMEIQTQTDDDLLHGVDNQTQTQGDHFTVPIFIHLATQTEKCQMISSSTQSDSALISNTASQTAPINSISTSSQTDLPNWQNKPAVVDVQVQTSAEVRLCGADAEETLKDLHESLSEIVERDLKKAENAQLKLFETECEQLRNENRKLENAFTKVSADLEKLKVKNEHLKEENVKFETALSQVKAESDQLRLSDNCNSNSCVLAKQIDIMSTDFEKCKQECCKLELENQKITTKYMSAQKDIILLQEQTISSNHTILRYQQALVDKNVEMQDKLQQLNQNLFDLTNSNSLEWTEVKSKKGPSNKSTNIPVIPDPTLPDLTLPDAPLPDGTVHVPRFKATKNSSATERTVTFKGPKNPLSNFAESKIQFDSRWFNCVEQAYQFAKARHHGWKNLHDLIWDQNDPYYMKKLASDFTTDDSWQSKKVDVMENLLKVKFRIPRFQEALKQTGKSRLEHNVSCNFWGSGSDGSGKNMMGKILEDIRARISDDVPNSDQPTALVVGHSHLNYFNTDKLSGIKLSKVGAVNTSEARDRLNNLSHDLRPSHVILHLITNDVKTRNPNEVTKDMLQLVQEYENKLKAKVFVSLAPPVADRKLDNDIQVVNSRLRRECNLVIDHDDAFTEHGKIIRSLYASDGVHLNNQGIRRLARNFKAAVLS